MRVPKPVHFARSLAVALMVAVAVTAFGNVASAAEGPKLSPAEYKPLPAGTSIVYDNRYYTVVNLNGFLTVFKTLTRGRLLVYLNAYAVFGEYANDMYTTVPGSYGNSILSYEIDSDEKKKLEAFWPLEVGKKISYGVQ